MKKEYKKETIVELQKVASEALSKSEQGYMVRYYYKTDKFMDKMAVYFSGVPERTRKVICPHCKKEQEIEDEKIKSIYFLAPPQLKMFINHLISSYFAFKEKRFGATKVSKSDLRIMFLTSFLKDIKQEQLKRWSYNGKSK